FELALALLARLGDRDRDGLERDARAELEVLRLLVEVRDLALEADEDGRELLGASEELGEAPLGHRRELEDAARAGALHGRGGRRRRGRRRRRRRRSAARRSGLLIHDEVVRLAARVHREARLGHFFRRSNPLAGEPKTSRAARPPKTRTRRPPTEATPCSKRPVPIETGGSTERPVGEMTSASSRAVPVAGS